MTGSGDPEVRILLMGSSGELVPSMKPALERAGCEVVVTDDVAPGLALVAAFMPDVVLVEHELPSGTGLDVLRSVRSDPGCAGTGVVLVVGDGQSAEMLTALDLGADDFLCLPFQGDEVVARVQAVLRQRTLVTPTRVAEARLAAAAASLPSAPATPEPTPASYAPATGSSTDPAGGGTGSGTGGANGSGRAAGADNGVTGGTASEAAGADNGVTGGTTSEAAGAVNGVTSGTTSEVGSRTVTTGSAPGDAASGNGAASGGTGEAGRRNGADSSGSEAASGNGSSCEAGSGRSPAWRPQDGVTVPRTSSAPADPPAGVPSDVPREP